MSKPKLFDLGKFLPGDKTKKTPSKPPYCGECKAPLILGRGYGYCDQCMLTTPFPVARILNKGPHYGKYVYLKDAVIRDLREEYDMTDVNDALQDRLKTKKYFVIEEIQ